MQFQFTLQYRDELEAARARFPGEAIQPPATRPLPVSVVTWSVVLVLCYGLYLLLNHAPAQSRAATTAGVADVAFEAEPLDDPLFAAGALVAGLAAACYVIPLAYLLGLRRSDRLLHDKPATVSLTDTGLILRTETKELSTEWSGVVAMAETRNVFVLKTMGDLRLTLPKRALRDIEVVNELRGFLHLHITPLAEVVAHAAPAGRAVPS